jgi:hypothetical protein
MKKRMPSTRTNLDEIVRGHYVKDEEDFAPNYLITESCRKIYRAKIVATVVNDPFISDDESYGRILLDDTTETLWAYFFRENTILLKGVSKGDLIQAVGKIGEWRNENRLNIEAVSVVPPNFWLLHRLELIKEDRNFKKEVKRAEKIKNEEENLKKARERAEAEGIPPEIIEAMYEMEYVAEEKGIDATLIKEKILSTIERLDEGEGVELDTLVSEITEFSPEEVESVVRDLLSDGEIFEPKINRYTKV